MCIQSLYTLLKVVGYYDLSVLSMSMMGFQQKKIGWEVGGWGELYPSLFWIFGIFFNFAKPLGEEKRRSMHLVNEGMIHEVWATYAQVQYVDLLENGVVERVQKPRCIRHLRETEEVRLETSGKNTQAHSDAHARICKRMGTHTSIKHIYKVHY